MPTVLQIFIDHKFTSPPMNNTHSQIKHPPQSLNRKIWLAFTEQNSCLHEMRTFDAEILVQDVQAFVCDFGASSRTYPVTQPGKLQEIKTQTLLQSREMSIYGEST